MTVFKEPTGVSFFYVEQDEILILWTPGMSRWYIIWQEAQQSYYNFKHRLDFAPTNGTQYRFVMGEILDAFREFFDEDRPRYIDIA